MPLIDIKDVSRRFGGLAAVSHVNLSVAEGEIHCLIGPNGAGKSTLFNCISRLYVPSAGHITFDGQRLTDLARHAIAGVGIGRTFQNVALFDSMTVIENIMIGCHDRLDAGFARNALWLPGAAQRERDIQDRAWRLVHFLGLEASAHRAVADLPFGSRKRVELGRALALEPKLILLDEPACGLNREEIAKLAELIVDLRNRLGITVLLVEHNMSLVMAISDKVVTLNFGRVIAQGTPAEVRAHPEVIRAYLGDDDEVSA